MSGTRDRIVQSAEKNLSRGRLDQALRGWLLHGPLLHLAVVGQEDHHDRCSQAHVEDLIEAIPVDDGQGLTRVRFVATEVE